jgi:rhodanese-related sulfurtransferase
MQVMIAEISIAEFEPLVASGSLVIDVREMDEFVSGHVPNAISIPLSTLQDRVEEFRHEGTVYVICQAGGRSMRACQYLADFDIDNLVNIAGGTSGWIASGHAVVTGE